MNRFICLLILSFSLFAQEIRDLDLQRSLVLAENAIDKGYYYASIPFLKEGLVITKTPNAKLDGLIDKVLENVGIAQIRFLPTDVLSKSNSLFAKIIHAKKLIDKKNYSIASSLLADIEENHFAQSLAFQVRGSIEMITNDFENARQSFNQCQLSSKKMRDSFKKTDTRHEYFDYIDSVCEVSIARSFYKEGKLRKALEKYSQVDMRSYLYPSVLLETAWTLYRLGDFQTSIGRTLSFRAPFLRDYFYPEAEQLAAMSFFKICHWKEVQDTLTYFDKNHYDNTKALIKYLDRNNLREQTVLKLVVEKSKTLNSFKITDRVFSRIRNTPSFIYHSNLLHLGVKELKQIRSQKGKDPLTGLYYNNTKRELKLKTVFLGYKIKSKLYKIANDFIKASQVLSLLGIESHGFKREKIANKQPYQINNTGRLPIVRTISSVNWDFKGEFWSDEIGSYVWSKESKCPKQ